MNLLKIIYVCHSILFCTIYQIYKYQVIPYFLPSVSSRQDIFLLFWKYVSVTLVLRACRFQSVIVRDLLSGDKKVLNFLGFQFFPNHVVH